MSFRLGDLKKSVRKGKDGYQVTATRLEGRQHEFRIEFLLQQFETHLGRPRRELDPGVLLDFVGDARLGRGLLATLAQWYRMRPRTFGEVLNERTSGWSERFEELEIAGPQELRAWMFAAVNRGGGGFLDPNDRTVFWPIQARALGVRKTDLEQLLLLDRPEEAVLVRTGPAPTTADVMAAYNARAYATLLRSAREVQLRCDAPAAALQAALDAWAAPLEVEHSREGSRVRLCGRPDAMGCWTRHGRRLERVLLELLSHPSLGVRELEGTLQVSERTCRFAWKREILTQLHSVGAASPDKDPLQRIDKLAAMLRRERENGGGASWRVRSAPTLVGAAGAVCLPHLELKQGDLSLYLRLTDGDPGTQNDTRPFLGKTPVALVSGLADSNSTLALHLPGSAAHAMAAGELSGHLRTHLDRLAAAVAAPPARTKRPLARAA